MTVGMSKIGRRENNSTDEGSLLMQPVVFGNICADEYS
ncbi:dihydroorotase [Acetobacter orientalis]|uniref:Dihydroorotase n=1 Tax=Acetobacter orientalis TaxID=146474 RepID=A0A2Z5ZEI8_9PROT|nr:dihydroorotase [Acetobacter orientalis]